jgi:hypothetical protein
MLIVYDHTTGEIVGHCSSVFDSGKWREATAAELFPNRANLSSVSVADDARFIAYGPNAWRLKKDANGIVTGIERLPALLVTCDAHDTDNDGVPDLPADGQSVAVITAKTSDGNNVTVTFRTTRGTLAQRSTATADGAATVELRSAVETVPVTVTVSAPGYRTGRLDMEFVPVPVAPPAPPADPPTASPAPPDDPSAASPTPPDDPSAASPTPPDDPPAAAPPSRAGPPRRTRAGSRSAQT